MKKNNVTASWLFIMLIMTAVFFAGYAGYHFVHQHLLAKKEAISLAIATPTITPSPINSTPKKTEKVKKTATKTDILNPTSNEPKYDFYKLLPAMTVTIPTEDESEQTTPAPLKTANNTLPLTAYVLQLASLQTAEDANQVGNTLKSAGYTTFIQHYQAPDHTTWYRVMVGPFKTIKEAEAEQKKLYAH